MNEAPKHSMALPVVRPTTAVDAIDDELLSERPPRKVHVVALNEIPFLPYIYGLLRVSAEEDPLVAKHYVFEPPWFFRSSVAEVVEGLEGLEGPGVLALSCYVWNFRRHMKIARLCKARHPQTLVVAGGPHIPKAAVERFFEEHPYVDIAVHAEGEIPFQRLLRENLREEPRWDDVPGISFRRDGKVVTNERKTLPRRIDAKSPYLLGYLDSAIETFRSLGIDYDAPWETNRGCPYRCSYCDWGSATMSKIRTFDQERLEQEIEFFGRARVPSVQINDANFGIVPRDLTIAEKLADTRKRHGYPKTIRLSFAKNSNARVFDISKLWFDQRMLASTTLSMQATNDFVLEAIDRENIKLESYKDLQDRYTLAGVSTYTEIILGLPMETKSSFKSGLSTVFEMGNHDDVRIYELSLLPNAPISDPRSVERYGLEAIDKHVSMVWPNTPGDEIEYISTVIQTNTMSREDWVDCSVYSRMIQLLHNGCYTRYVAIYLQRAHDVPYHVFYDGLQQHFLLQPKTVLGGVLRAFQYMYRAYQRGAELPFIDISRSPREALPLLKARPALLPVDWSWICISSCLDRFYAELRGYLQQLGSNFGRELDELLAFQRDIMLHLDYDPSCGKLCTYERDFPAFFAGKAPLREQRVKVHYRDVAMGNRGEYPLERGNAAKFLDAALGGLWADVSSRFQHSVDRAEITYEDVPTSISVHS